jgi:uncharacterized protein (TIGR00369 family)
VDDSAAALKTAFEASASHRLIKGRLEPTSNGVLLEAELGESFSISLGQLHGGVVASLLDTAATWALISKTGSAWLTADLRVDYLKPVPVGRVRVEGVVVRSGRRVGRATATISVDAGAAAIAVGTFLPVG